MTLIAKTKATARTPMVNGSITITSNSGTGTPLASRRRSRRSPNMALTMSRNPVGGKCERRTISEAESVMCIRDSHRGIDLRGGVPAVRPRQCVPTQVVPLQARGTLSPGSRPTGWGGVSSPAAGTLQFVHDRARVMHRNARNHPRSCPHRDDASTDGRHGLGAAAARPTPLTRRGSSRTNGGRAMPCSVMIAEISLAGVTSNAGLATRVP